MEVKKGHRGQGGHKGQRPFFQLNRWFEIIRDLILDIEIFTKFFGPEASGLFLGFGKVFKCSIMKRLKPFGIYMRSS